MEHPVTGSVEVSVKEGVTVSMEVVSSVLNEVDTAYHYDLEGTFSDGNNAATVQLKDVHQSLIVLKEGEKE